MSPVVSSISIGRPIEQVFAVLTDVELTGRWFPADVEEHWTTPPPHGVGSTRHAVIRMFGRTVENDAVATVYEPPHRATMEGTSANAPFATTLTFQPTDDGTRVVATTTFRFKGAQRIVGPLFARWYRRSFDRGLANLKALMESGSL
jgi:uncharacterized protein YndB with AHSA1/START domain